MDRLVGEIDSLFLLARNCFLETGVQIRVDMDFEFKQEYLVLSRFSIPR